MLVAAAVFAALVAASLPAAAGSAPLRMVVLGETDRTPPPACPGTRGRECQAVGSVTGFQAMTGAARQPFEAPFDGKIVAWSISLSRPSAAERTFFDELFGAPPKARIAVLRRVRGSKPPVYRMVRQSPLQVLTPYLGGRPVFALEHPLNVVRGQTVGLTIPTWAPALAIGLGPRNTWRGSRKAGTCSSSDAHIQASHPQQRVGSKKQYGCYFSTSRLLYNAYLVKKPVSRRRR